MSPAPRRPALTDVTLVAVTSVALQPTVDALRASVQQADFGKVLLLSDRRPPDLNDGIEWRQIDRLDSRADYSRFMLRELVGHVGTSHALCVQWDGFVVNGEAWDPHFLEYDYIGAVWPHFNDAHNVGNGGFSLRSRRLLEACTRLPPVGGEAEDMVISRSYRPWLEGQGIRFAPGEIARNFAYERTEPTGTELGFHGAFNLMRHVTSGEMLWLFKSLEPHILTRGEHWEIFARALRRGQLALASAVLKRLISRML